MALGLITNLNTTCLHSLYRDQLAEIWLPGNNRNLAELNPCRRGGPLPLFNATLNRMGRREDPDAEQKSRFLMSPLFCGSKRVGYRETREYLLNGISVADAIAVSGAAVSASAAPGLLYRVLLFLTNFRLGQWYQNPAQITNGHYWPSPLRILVNLLWNPTERSHVFVTDGGHLDNLGLSALFERRCRVIIAADAGLDPEYQFEDLVSLLHAARTKYGIELLSMSVRRKNGVTAPVDDGLRLDCLRPANRRTTAIATPQTQPLAPSQIAQTIQPSPLADAHFVVMHLRYPTASSLQLGQNRDCHLIFCKASLTGDEPIGLTELLRRHDDPFPNDVTSDQFLPPDRFAAYNTLGFHIANAVEDFLAENGLAKTGTSLPTEWTGSRPANAQFREQRQEVLPWLEAHPNLNAAAVPFLLSFVGEWLKQREKGPVVSDELEAIALWAKEDELPDHQASRELCRGLEKLRDEHTVLVQRTPEFAEFLSDMFAYRGEGRFSRPLKQLAGWLHAAHQG